MLLVYVCLSKNFSMSTEKVAKPAKPIHAAFGPPDTKSNSSKSPDATYNKIKQKSIERGHVICQRNKSDYETSV